MKKILRVNMRTKDVSFDDTPDNYLKNGGRGLIAKIMLQEVKPTCEPLGRNNKLIFANGLLAGTNVSSASRISIGAKSPLTGGIKESNGGGIIAMWLARVGLKAVIIEDIPNDNNWYYLKIDKSGSSLEPANEYIGMGTFEFCEKMLDKYPNCGVSCIGPAGERLYSAAGIATMDKEKSPNRYSGRGGLGAVMGSKKIKGIVVTDKESVHIERKDDFKKALKEYTKILSEAPSTQNYKTLGTASTVRVTHELTGLPVRNFSGEQLENVENIYGETLYELIKLRGGEGKTAHACMPGCIIQCSNVVPNEEGKTIVSPLEYETIGLLGSNLGISDLDVIARMNAICNDIGIDTIEIGGAIGVAMESGLAKFGDTDSAFELLREVKEGTVLGRVLGNGTTITGKVLGVTNIPAVNGQSMPAYDPRTIKGMGVTYATSPMGADHTYGPLIKSDKDWTEASNEAQILMATLDSLGLCMFTRNAIASNQEILVDLVNARFGWNLNMEWLKKMSKDTIKDEYTFNKLAGFSKENYRLPESFTERTVPKLNAVFDIEKESLDSMEMMKSW